MNILLILLSVLLNCAAQLLIRKGMMIVGEINASNVMQMFAPMLTNVFLWLALLCYGFSFFLWMVVLSRVEVSYAYPFLSVGYVITMIAGYAFFAEDINFMRILGVAIICLGVFLISRS